jgi:hypothetical protein
MFGGDLSTESVILDWADEAMYWAKAEGGRTIRFYDVKNSSDQTLTKLYQLAIDEEFSPPLFKISDTTKNKIEIY